jgi:hypothetical protein
MKWMLIVLVFGTPMQTGIIFNSLDECLKAESTMRAEWSRVYSANPKKYQDQPVTQDEVAKQMTRGTCIPHAALSH